MQALLHKAIYEECRPLIVGDANVIEKAAVLLGHPELTVHRVDSVEQAAFTWGIIDVYHLDLVDLARFEYGKVSAMCGRAAFECVRKVIELALDDEVDATCTNALNKEAMNLALAPEGHDFDGIRKLCSLYSHREIYDATGAPRSACGTCFHALLAAGSVRPCEKAACTGCHSYRGQRMQKLRNPAPANRRGRAHPHAGENGLFGREELDEIIPAIRAAQDEGLCVDGPVPPDSLFPKALGGWYDIVVAMYHDQGHIPLKTVGFVYDREKQAWKAVEGVNITLGLPIIRTSVDHGTGFDQAGKGTSNELSLLNAIQYAVTMARNRNIKE